jgi:hypothetical protein
MLSLSKDGAGLSRIQIVQPNPMKLQKQHRHRAIRALPAGLPLPFFTILALLLQTMDIIAPFVAQITVSTV